MKVLVVEDSEDLRRAMVMVLKGALPEIEVIEASDGQVGLDILGQDNDIDCVFCDYNMPKKNGGDVFRFMKDKGWADKYVLVSTVGPERDAVFNGYSVPFIEKPEIFKPMIKVISQLNERVFKYFEFGLNLFLQEGLDCWDIYLRLSDDNFVKVIRSRAENFQEELCRLKDKGVSQVYLSIKDASEAFHCVYRDILSTIDAVEETSQQNHLMVNEVIYKAVQLFGVTQEVQKLVKKSVQLAVKRIEGNKDLKSLVSGFSKSDYISTHSTVLGHVAGYLVPMLPKSADSDFEAVALAAILHDLVVEVPEMAKIQDLEELLQNEEGYGSQERQEYRNHPILAAEMTKMFSGEDFPPGVDQLILHHHERPDGSGFPNGLRDEEIPALSALFILAHGMTDVMLEKGELINSKFIKKYLRQKYRGKTFDGLIGELLKRMNDLD